MGENNETFIGFWVFFCDFSSKMYFNGIFILLGSAINDFQP